MNIKNLLSDHIKKFSSGPAFKGKHWKLENLSNAMVGRLHRSRDGVARISYMMDLIRNALNIPDDYYIAPISGSTTGAMSALTWQVLGVKDITSLIWDIFAGDWSDDAKGLYSDKINIYRQDGLTENIHIPNKNTDLLLTWTSTATGQRPSSWEFLKKYKNESEKDNIVVCDVAATAFIEPLDWSVLDAVGFSLQKGLGGEPGLGLVVLSPAAYSRLYQKLDHVVPKLFRLQVNEKPNDLIFTGHAMNTVSMLVVEDAIVQLEYILDLGMDKWYERAEENKKAAIEYILNSDGLELIYDNLSLQSCTSICVGPKLPSAKSKYITGWSSLDDKEKWDRVREVEFAIGLHDIIGHTRLQPCWRFWIGPTMDTTDLLEGLQLLNDTIA